MNTENNPATMNYLAKNNPASMNNPTNNNPIAMNRNATTTHQPTISKRNRFTKHTFGGTMNKFITFASKLYFWGYKHTFGIHRNNVFNFKHLVKNCRCFTLNILPILMVWNGITTIPMFG